MYGKSLTPIAIAACSLALAASAAADDTGPEDRGGALQPGIQRTADDGSWYVGARAGATYIERDDFKLGQIARDANDGPPSYVKASRRTPTLKTNAWGGGSEYFAGMQITEKHAAEVRVGFALMDESSKTRLKWGSDNGDNFFVPYLDGGRYPDGDRPRVAGVYGVRYRDRDGPVELTVRSDTTYVDAGFDFVSTHLDRGGCTLQSVVGPTFIYLDQEFDHTVRGDALGWSRPTTVRTDERLTEYYAGAKLGFRAAHTFSQASRLSLVLHGDVSLLYRHSDLEAKQDIADDLTIGIDAEDEAFSAKFGALAGADVQVTDNLTIGAFYQLGAYVYGGRIDNPDLALVDLEGDYRWAGDRKAGLKDQSLITHSATVRVVFRF